MSAYSVLVLTSDGAPPASLAGRLSFTGVSLHESDSLQQAKQELLSRRYAVFVNRCDQVGALQFELLRFIRNNNLPTRAIINALSGSIEVAVRLMKEGAGDFIVGGTSDSRLANAILQQGVKSEEKPAGETHADAAAGEAHILIGQSSAIRNLRSTIRLVAKSYAPVLITGESGTGKEIVARQIHHFSDRSAMPCVALNCAALPKTVIENELFGHEKGAFSGAVAKKAGCFELANQGSLFLDEIGEMDIDSQVKLLRVLEHKAFRRLGGKEEISVNVKAIAATNKNLMEAIQRGAFRQDLYYRLSVIELELPPLRERREDIPLLASYFLGGLCTRYDKPRQRFSDHCLELLAAHPWPGNVRELRNVVERSIILCPHEEIDLRYLPDRVKPQVPRAVNGYGAPDSERVRNDEEDIRIHLGSSTREAEQTLILKTLASVGYNKSRAAKMLGVSRKTLYNKINAFFPDGIEATTGRYEEIAAINDRFSPRHPPHIGRQENGAVLNDTPEHPNFRTT